MKQIFPWMFYSLLAAVGSAITGLSGVFPMALLLNVVWIFIFIAAIVRLRLRSLWLLAGAPFAFATIVFVVLFANALSACMANSPARYCLP